MSKENLSRRNHDSAEGSRPVLYVSSEKPAFVREAEAKGAIFLRRDNGKPANEQLKEEIAKMSPEQKAAYEERLIELSEFYEGPGGP